MTIGASRANNSFVKSRSRLSSVGDVLLQKKAKMTGKMRVVTGTLIIKHMRCMNFGRNGKGKGHTAPLHCRLRSTCSAAQSDAAIWHYSRCSLRDVVEYFEAPLCTMLYGGYEQP